MSQDDVRGKFRKLLKKLFQFDCAELDFGIYRIMNQKRAVIQQFIEKDLLDGVATELSRGAINEGAKLKQQCDELASKIRQDLGEDALDTEGNLTVPVPRGRIGEQCKKYMELRERVGNKAKSSNEREADIFNHLLTFFSRYYDDGDFMSLRRYSKREKYAIPYNGEKVYLHWANADQYYIKTGENFTDYSYKHGGWTVRRPNRSGLAWPVPRARRWEARSGISSAATGITMHPRRTISTLPATDFLILEERLPH